MTMQMQPDPKVSDALSNFAGKFSTEILQNIFQPGSFSSSGFFGRETQSAGGRVSEISAIATNSSLYKPVVPLRKKSKGIIMEYIYFGPGPAKLPKEVEIRLYRYS